ncbi:MAG: hypothetical protein P4N60_19355 [Verrucomicrobiae bacterium]|nr:hypothetical protein [Verrucomicrobiae bacterium]
MITNEQCYLFMLKLETDQRSKNSMNLDEFETGFLASWVEAGQPTRWFSPGRIIVINRMWMRYGAELNFPHPDDRITERPSIADADPDGCQYLIKDEGRQRRCNDPAVCREVRQGSRTGLRYCEPHQRAVKQACKNIVLVKFP